MFRQLFQLVPKTGGYYVHNDIFRAGTANPDNAPADIGGATIKQIITTYYQLFDADRSKLTVLYVRPPRATCRGRDSGGTGCTTA